MLCVFYCLNNDVPENIFKKTYVVIPYRKRITDLQKKVRPLLDAERLIAIFTEIK